MRIYGKSFCKINKYFTKKRTKELKLNLIAGLERTKRGEVDLFLNKIKEDYKFIKKGKKIFDETNDEGRKDFLARINFVYKNIGQLSEKGFLQFFVFFLKISNTFHSQDTYNSLLKNVLEEFKFQLSSSVNGFLAFSCFNLISFLTQIKDFKEKSSQIFNTFKANTNEENLKSLNKVVEMSQDLLFQNMEKMEEKDLSAFLSFISKEGLFVDNIDAIERVVSIKINQFNNEDFVGILYSIFKNKIGSEKLFDLLDAKAEKIINSIQDDTTEEGLVHLTRIINAYYNGYKVNKKVFKKAEEIIVNFYFDFKLDDRLTILHSLFILDQSLSNEFVGFIKEKMEEEVKTNQDYLIENLSTFNCFRIIHFICKTTHFETSISLWDFYAHFYLNKIKAKQVDEKQIFSLLKILNSMS
jgi:hypothetical protein